MKNDKNRIALNEAQLSRVIRESIRKVLMENIEDEYRYYVAADVSSEYFNDYDEAYNYALQIAEESMRQDPDNWEEVHLMDNQAWNSLVIFDEKGIHDLENGRFMPW